MRQQQALSAATAAAVALSAQPAFAGDIFADGTFVTGALVIFGGVTVISVALLPFICGTLNPIQMAVNLGVVEGEVSNERKFKNNGEPMEHGTKFGHVWYDTSAFVNGKDIDFAGTSKTLEAQDKA